jgi:hypothetical protein
LVARPGEVIGDVLVTQVGQTTETVSYNVTKGHPIDALMLNNSNGKVALALSYVDGKYLRVFHLGKEAQLMKEVWRSRTAAHITSMGLCTENEPNVLICSSDSSNKTVHLFHTPDMKPNAVAAEENVVV